MEKPSFALSAMAFALAGAFNVALAQQQDLPPAPAMTPEEKATGYHHVSLGYGMALDNPKAEINVVKQ